jgi:hypothetical protein
MANIREALKGVFHLEPKAGKRTASSIEEIGPHTKVYLNGTDILPDGIGRKILGSGINRIMMRGSGSSVREVRVLKIRQDSRVQDNITQGTSMFGRINDGASDVHNSREYQLRKGEEYKAARFMVSELVGDVSAPTIGQIRSALRRIGLEPCPNGSSAVLDFGRNDFKDGKTMQALEWNRNGDDVCIVELDKVGPHVWGKPTPVDDPRQYFSRKDIIVGFGCVPKNAVSSEASKVA